MARPSVVLPEPDSPTTPSVPPALISMETPSTAFTCPTTRRSTPLRIGNQILRSSASTIVAALASDGGGAPFGAASISIRV